MECHLTIYPGKCRTIHSWGIDSKESDDIFTEELQEELDNAGNRAMG